MVTETTRTCDYCKAEFTTTNSRKKYCSPRCNKLSYQARRYKRDDNFGKRMRSCWQSYGMDDCPHCGMTKKRSDRVCSNCQKVDELDIETLAKDKESLFNNPESLLRIEIMMASSSHPEYTKKELFDMFKDAIDDKKKVMKAIESILKGVINNE